MVQLNGSVKIKLYANFQINHLSDGLKYILLNIRVIDYLIYAFLKFADMDLTGKTTYQFAK